MKDLNYKKLDTTSDGDFNLLDDITCLQQDQDIVIQSDKGKIINNPLVGVGMFKYLNGPVSILDINKNIKTECRKEKINVQSIQIIEGNVYVKSNEIT